MAVTSSLVARSFITNPETPTRINSAASSASACRVKTMTLASEPAAFSRSNASMPFNPGIEMSVTMTSGRNRVAASTRRLAVGHRSHDLELVLQQVDEAFQHECMIVGDQHPGAIHHNAHVLSLPELEHERGSLPRAR